MTRQQGLFSGWPIVAPLIVLFLSIGLGGCQHGGGPAALYAPPPSDAPRWFEQEGGMRFQATVLVRSAFAKVPLLAAISVDANQRLEFAGVSEWGLTLAQAFVSQGDDPAPARLHPMLARIPGRASRLPPALKRVFLIWPEPPGGHPSAGPGGSGGSGGGLAGSGDSGGPGVRYLVDARGRITEKKGVGKHGAWKVLLRYPEGAALQAPPQVIEYKGEGLAIVFKLKDVSGDE